MKSLDGTRVLVTGASGFIGSHLVDRLVREGAVVGALSRHRGRLDQIAGNGDFTFLPCDLTHPDHSHRVIASFAPEILFHIASEPDGPEGAEHARKTFNVNVLATLNALEAFRSCRGRVVLYGDSCKVYGNGPVPYRESTPLAPNSSYAISKAAGWQFCHLYAQLYDIAAISLRPTIIYGPRQGYNLISFVVERILDGAPEIRLDGGDQTRDPLFIEDAVDAFVTAAGIGEPLSGRAINIGGGRELSVRELAELIVGMMGRGIPVVACPSRARPTEIWRSFCDNAEAEKLLGWRPRTALPEGLKFTLDYIVGDRLPYLTAHS